MEVVPPYLRQQFYARYKHDTRKFPRSHEAICHARMKSRQTRGHSQLKGVCALKHTGGGEDKAVQQTPGGGVNQAPPRRSALGSTAYAVGQAWMYITDEAAAVAAEGPQGLDRAAQHHLPMPKPHFHFNIASEGRCHT